MPTSPTPFSGAATSDATAVPCSPPSRRGSWALSVTVFARPRNSGWVTSIPESTIVTGVPAGGGVSVSTPTAARHHSVGTSGSAKSSTASVPAGRFGALRRRAPRARSARTTRAAAARGNDVEAERRRDERRRRRGHERRPRCSAPAGAARRASRPAATRAAAAGEATRAPRRGERDERVATRIALSSTCCARPRM